jgi:hypothetical protein
MNGKLFTPLQNLLHVFMNGNLCIDRAFTTPRQIKGMARKVAHDCEFEEDDDVE